MIALSASRHIPRSQTFCREIDSQRPGFILQVQRNLGVTFVEPLISLYLVLFSLSSIASTNVKMPMSNVICYKSSPAQSLIFLFLSVFFSLAVLNRTFDHHRAFQQFIVQWYDSSRDSDAGSDIHSFPNKICGHSSSPCSRSSPCS